MPLLPSGGTGGGGGEGREVAAEALLLQVSPAVLKLC